MGLFDSIINTAKTVITQPIKSFVEGAKAVSGFTANPATAISQGIIAAEKKVADQGILISSVKSVSTIGAVTAGVVAGASALTGGTVAKVISTTVATSPIKSAIAAGAGLVGVGVAASNPKAAVATVANAPSSLVNFGSNVGNLATNPSLLAAEKVLKENPLVSAVVLGGAGVVGAKAATAVANIVTTERNTKALETLADTPPSKQILNEVVPVEKPANEVPINTTGQQSQMLPVTPQTNSITKTSKRKRTSRKKVKIMPITQKTNIIISNRAIGTTNKTYINREVYA